MIDTAIRDTTRSSTAATVGSTEHVRRWWIAPVLVATVLIAAINLWLGADGFVSADEQVAHQQVEFLADGHWVEPIPEPMIDPDSRWNPLNGVSPGDGVYAPYAKHPAFPLALVPLDALAGRIGRFLTVGLGAVASALVVGFGAERRRCGAGRTSFVLMLVGTPMLLHATVLWAHSLATAGAGLAMLGVQEIARQHRASLRSIGAVVGGLIVATSLRSDALIFFILLGGLIGLFALRRRAWTELLVGGGVVVATVVVFWLEAKWRSSILGPSSSTALTVPPEPMFDLGIRSVLVIKWLIGNDAGPLGMLRVIGLGVMCFELLRRRDHDGPVRVGLLVVGALCFAASVNAGPTYSFLVTAPLMVLGLMMVDRGDRFVRMVALLTATFFVAVVLTSYEAAGGGDWGGRYLSLLLAPQVMIAGPEVHRAWSEPRLRSVVVAGSIASLTIACGILVHANESRDLSTAILADSLSQLDQISDPNAIVVVTDARIARLLGETETGRRLFQVPPDQLGDFDAALGPVDHEIVVFDLLSPAELPTSWQVVEQDGSFRRVST